ncbi:MAG: preprotein translocase subunit SecF [Actinomycetota bacterium]|jgi:preprotein translocase subunit SecF|nr:preprotein translocase subunit SecF [Actinomycetota bacterium]
MSRDAEGRTLRHRLYHGETSWDFVGRSRIWFLASALVVAAGLLSLLTQGLNYGIDFKGGTSWEVKAPGVSVAEARDKLRPFGMADAKIQIAGGDTVRVQSDTRAPAEQTQITDAMAELGHVDPGQVSVNDVGPSWGKDVTKKARTALIAFIVLISAYITLRFEWKMALAAMAAVVHDILITVGIYSISRFEVTPATVVAFLTILGYSLYDTIVVFDKVEENTKGLSATGRLTYTDTVNLSMNQVLMRSLNTSLVAILPILSILLIGAGVMGATTLKDFGLALLVGLLTGAYSSIFIAAPILAKLKEREPRYVAVRQRLSAKGGGSGVLTPAAAAALAGSGGGGAAAGRVKGSAGPPKAVTATKPGASKPAGAKPGGAKSPAAKPPAGKPAAGAKAAAKDGDVLVPARPTSAKPAGGGTGTGTGTTAGGATAATGATGTPRPPANRPGAPRPRKKGKKR